MELILLKGAFSEFVEDVQNAIEENIKNPSWRERTYNPDDGGQAFSEIMSCVEQNLMVPKFSKKFKNASIAAKLMRSSTARIFMTTYGKRNSVVTPRHQDQPYYLCERGADHQFLGPIGLHPRNRTIEYVSGSHSWGRNFKPQRFDGTDLFQGDKSELFLT